MCPALTLRLVPPPPFWLTSAAHSRPLLSTRVCWSSPDWSPAAPLIHLHRAQSVPLHVLRSHRGLAQGFPELARWPRVQSALWGLQHWVRPTRCRCPWLSTQLMWPPAGRSLPGHSPPASLDPLQAPSLPLAWAALVPLHWVLPEDRCWSSGVSAEHGLRGTGVRWHRVPAELPCSPAGPRHVLLLRSACILGCGQRHLCCFWS